MTRRKPKEFSFLEGGGGKKVRGAGQVTEGGTSLWMGPYCRRIPETVHRFMSQEKRRTHKRERREGKHVERDA